MGYWKWWWNKHKDAINFFGIIALVLGMFFGTLILMAIIPEIVMIGASIVAIILIILRCKWSYEEYKKENL